MIVKLSRCDIQTAQMMSDASGLRCIVPTDGNTFASVHAILRDGAWATAVFKVRKSNDPSADTIADHSTAISLTSAAQFTNLFRIESEYLVLECTTGEGAASKVDVFIYLRKDNVAVS